MTWWKVYGWLFLLLNLYSVLIIGEVNSVTIFLSILLSFGLNLITLLFAYKKPLPQISLVKTVFFVNLFFLSINVLYQLVPQFSAMTGVVEEISIESLLTTLISYIPSLPAFYVCYKVIFKQKS